MKVRGGYRSCKRKMRYMFRFISLACSLLILVTCSSTPKLDERVVLKAGNIDFTMFDLDMHLSTFNYMDAANESYKKIDFLKQHLDKLIVADAGLEMGMDDSVVVDSVQVRRVLKELVYKRQVTDKLHIDMKDVRKFWEKYGGEVMPAQILVGSKELADSLYNILKDNPDQFDSLAMRYSEDEATSYKGGEIGWSRLTNVREELLDVVFGLEPGQVAPPARTPFGWHIIKLLDRRGNDEQTWEKEKGNYRGLYSLYQRYDLQREFVKEQKGKLHFKIYPDSVQKLADVARALKEKADDQSKRLSFYISDADLSEPQANIVVAEIDRLKYRAKDFISDLKRTYRNEPMDFDNREMTEQLIEQLMTPDMMYVYGLIHISKDDPGYQRYYEDARIGLIYDKTLHDYLLDTVTVTEDQIKARYKNSQHNYELPSEVKVAEILQQTEGEAKDILKQLQGGAPFADLVKKTIRPGFAETGGNLGYTSPKRFPMIYNEAKKLKTGDYGGPILFDGNWAVFKVLDIRPGRLEPLAEVEPVIQSQILAENKYSVLHQWLEKRKQKVINYIDSSLVKANLITGKLDDES